MMEATMKAAFTFILTSLIILFSPALAQDNLVILGTIHRGNPNLDQKDLLKRLEEEKPDIILWEQDKPFKPVFGLLTANWLRIWHPDIEQMALQRYYRANPSVPILPYDTSFADKHAYRKEYQRKNDSIVTALQLAGLKGEDSSMLHRWLDGYHIYDSLASIGTLDDVNQLRVYGMARELYQMEELRIFSLAERYLNDQALLEWYRKDLRFWHLRNRYMARQIQSVVQNNPGKKVLVLTGLSHKYYLVDALTEAGIMPNASIRQ